MPGRFDKYKEAWESKDGLPDGIHYFDVHKVQLKETDNGHEFLKINGQVAEGSFKGTEVEVSFMTYHEDKGPMKMNLSRIGDINNMLDEATPKDDFGQAISNLEAYLPGKKVALEAEKKGGYVNYMINSIEGKAESKPAKAAKDGEQPSASDDDIPF